MGFTNTNAGGLILVRPAFRSPNYVAGVSGWTINADGTAEFGSAVIRGILDVLGSNGSEILIKTIGTQAFIILHPATGSAQDAKIFTAGATTLEIDGPVTGLGTPPNITLADGAGITVNAGQASTDVTLTGTRDVIVIPAGKLTASVTSFVLNSVTQGEGLRSFINNTGASAAIGAETVVLTAAAADYRTGRAYAAEIRAWHTIAAGGTAAVLRVRKGTTTAGTLLGASRVKLTNGDLTMHMHDSVIFVNTSGSTVNTAICLTLNGEGGNVTQSASTDTPRSFRVVDIGAAADYPNYVSL